MQSYSVDEQICGADRGEEGKLAITVGTKSSADRRQFGNVGGVPSEQHAESPVICGVGGCNGWELEAGGGGGGGGGEGGGCTL